MADDKPPIIKFADPPAQVSLVFPFDLQTIDGWQAGASYHIEETESGFVMVKDERPV